MTHDDETKGVSSIDTLGDPYLAEAEVMKKWMAIFADTEEPGLPTSKPTLSLVPNCGRNLTPLKEGT